MAAYVVRLAARADVEEIALWIARDRPEAALRFLDAVEGAFESTARMPRSGRAVAFRSPHLRGVRRLPVPGFEAILVFYRPVRGGVDVLRVIHGARDLPVVLEEE